MEKLKYPTDLTGLKFGRLTVVRKVGVNKNYNSVWLCLCDCGNETETIRGSLVTQNTVSCGCRRKEGLIIGHKLMSKIKNPDIECNYCKTKFHVKRSRQEKTSKLFCSMKCKIEYSKTDKTVLGNYKNRDEITQYFYQKSGFKEITSADLPEDFPRLTVDNCYYTDYINSKSRLRLLFW